MNLSQLQTQLQALGYGTDTLAQQTAFLNDAYRTVYSQDRWPFLEKQATLPVTVGVNVVSYASITDLAEFDAVRLSLPGDTTFQQSVNLDNVEPQDMRDREQLDNQLDVPGYWSIIANTIHIHPFPNQAYTLNVDYIYSPPDLVNPTDTPVIPPQYHDLIVWGAIKNINFRERDIYSLETSSNEYEIRLKRMKESLMLRQRQTSSRIKKTGLYRSSRMFPWTSG